MKRAFASFAVMAAVAIAAPAMAGDQNFVPHGGAPQLSGNLSFSQSIVSTSCSTTFGLSTSPDGKYASVTSANFTGTTLCDGLDVMGSPPWDITILTPNASSSGQATSVRIHNLYVKTSAGYCQGDVDAVWSNAGTGSATFSNAVLPGKIKVGPLEVTANCTISGTLTASNPSLYAERL